MNLMALRTQNHAENEALYVEGIGPFNRLFGGGEDKVFVGDLSGYCRGDFFGLQAGPGALLAGGGGCVDVGVAVEVLVGSAGVLRGREWEQKPEERVNGIERT